MFENTTLPKDFLPSDPRFGAGPSLIPIDHLKSLALTGHELLGTSHRKPAVKNIVHAIKSGLKEYFGLPEGHEVVLGNGGATLLFDMIGLGLVEKSSSHFVTGEFSSKWFKSHSMIPWIKSTEHKVDFGEGINPTDTGDDTICMTLNETSTGVIVTAYPEVGASTLLCVDATSGGGQVQCDVSKTDVFFFSPQKVFASEGGLWIAIMSQKAINRALKIVEQADRYIPGMMNFKTAIENSRKDGTYNTPAVTTLFLLNEQIKSMNSLGYAEVLQQSKKKAELLYSWAEEKSYLSPYIKDSNFRSTCVGTIDLDDKYDASELTKRLRDEKVVYDIDAYRKLGRNQLRIGFFHNVTYENLAKLTKLISYMIEKE